MNDSRLMNWMLCCLVALAGVAGCSTDTTSGEATGTLSLNLVLAGGVEIDVVDWEITGNGMDMGGSIDVSAPGSTASVEVYGLPVGKEPYVVELSAVSVDKQVTCRGSAEFDVEVGVSTPVMVILNCKLPQELGGVRVNGKFNICAQLTKMVVSPLQTSVGNDISLFSTAQDEEGDPIAYMWTSHSGSIADPAAASTTYTCTEVGDDDITVLVTDDDGTYCISMWTVRVTCVEGDGGDLCDDVICEDDGNECTDEACNPANGQCETSNNTNPCNDDTGTCSAGVCEPNPECTIDDDCSTEEICVANVCRSDPDGFCDTGICTESPAAKELCVGAFIACILDNPDEAECIALSILLCNDCNEDSDCNAGEVCNENNLCESTAEVVYEQNFNLLDINSPTIGDGWLFFANVFDSGGNFKFPYSGAAPNGTGNISAIVDDQGGAPQEPQQLSVFSDYACCGTSEGHFGTDLVEINVFEERTITIDEVGETLVFTFDAKGGNIEPPTTALAFIQTLDPNAGFDQTNFVPIDMTSIGTSWNRYEISLPLTDPALEGQILQFGFRSTTSGFTPSQNVYDNILATLE